MLGVVTAYDFIKMNLLESKITLVKTGDSKEKVLRILGKPDCRMSKESKERMSTPKTLCFSYGKFLDWKNAFHSNFPFIYPFKTRFFIPHGDDIIIYFDDKDLVSDIYMPK